jgi:hypothetical protein
MVAVSRVGLPTPVFAQDIWSPTRFDAAPEIDGVLDDAVWAGGTQAQGFRTYSPDYGRDMLADTRVYMGYDDENLYFGFVAYDPDPSQIRASVTARDNVRRDDWVAINLDSFGDAQSLYAFYINPYGVQGDSRLAGGTEDQGVDLVWYSGGRIDEQGYTIEVQIPLKSIRFSDGSPVKMGVIFERRISRNSEWGTLPELDPARAGQWTTQMYPLQYDGIANRRLFELLPAATYAVDRAAPEGTLVTDYEAGDLSLTAKLGLTSDLVLDGTLNPDFSQIEADAGQVDVNLRSDLFYPEKRPFFLEGREHFGLAASGGQNPMRSIVYTRKIVDPIAGSRLSGKLGSKNTLASIYAVDELPTGSDDDYAHVPVLRYKRSLSEDGYLGALYAGRETRSRHNHIAGIDGQFRVGESVRFEMHAFGSRTRSDVVGSTGDGHSLAARFSSSTRLVDWAVEAMDLSEDFQPDVGFITRSGLFRAVGLVRRRFYPDVANVRSLAVDLSTSQTYDRPGELWEASTRVGWAANLFGNLGVRGSFERSSEIFLGEEFDTHGASVHVGGLIANRGAFGVTYSAQKRPIYTQTPYQGRSRTLSAILGLQPSPRFDSEISFNAADIYRDSDSAKLFDVNILRVRATVQPNRYLFFRAITEYNWFREELITDFLASFTYIPGTVLHIGYGSLYDRTRWDGGQYVDADRFFEMKRRFFFKTSYLFRS